MTLDTIVQASPDQVSCGLGGETAILNLKTGVYYGVDQVGARIWNRMQQPTTVGALRDAILAEFDVEPDTCEPDLFALLKDLATEGLIHVQFGVPA